ncbi:MAG TPA: RNA polymerase sigma factor SigJ, partial [Polyangiaceae bacterium]|nr:RNA polymerase sigma factor SigJ [Polyangiaceae bacterium]
MNTVAKESDPFELHRAFLVRLAYRMLGSVTDAEDVVQDAFLRWNGVDQKVVTNVRAYLARSVSRLCIDRMRAEAARREAYVGTWLPEPVVTEPGDPFVADLSIALFLTLERLSPLERAAFLLHDVFDMDYIDVAGALDRTEAACRQLAARAREHVQRPQQRFTANDETRDQLVEAFMTAALGGNVAALTELLAENAVLYADGGGKRAAVLEPIHGNANIAAFYAMLAERRRSEQIPLEPRERVDINALPGFIVHASDGVQTMAFETD